MAIDKALRFDPSGALGSGCPVNIITGARTFGKTYAFKKRAIKNFIERGETWVYMRTLDAQLDRQLTENPEPFFSDIERNREFPGWVFSTRGRIMYAAREPKEGKKPAWVPFGSFFALTTFDSRKGATMANCSMLVWDEFISERDWGGYPKDATDKLLNVWETLDRRENRVRVFLLANVADIVNPVFRAWRIQPIPKGTHRLFPIGNTHIYYENAYSPEFAAAAADTDIGQFAAGSSYERYSQGNEFKQATGLFVEAKPKNCRCLYCFKWGKSNFGVWCDPSTFVYYVTRKAAKDAQTFVFTHEDLSPDYMMIDRATPFVRNLIKWYKQGAVRFDSDSTRELWVQLSRNLGLR